MSVSHGIRSFCALLVVLSFVLAMPGCGEKTANNGSSAGTDPKLGERRKEMSDFMKNSGSPKKP